MAATSTAFDELVAALDAGGVDSCLQHLAEQLKKEKKFQQYFEALRMQARRELDLSVLSDDMPAEWSEAKCNEAEEKLSTRYGEILREVGLLMFGNGEISHGWMFLQYAGETDLARAELEKLEVHEDNMDEFVDVTLNQGLAPALGYAVVLENYGTCNAITTFDQSLYGKPLSDRQAAARLLVNHIHEELTATVRADVAQQQGAEPAETTLRDLVAERDWLFSDGAYHIDTTHLASGVRIARLLDDEESLRIGIDLTEYGRRLQSPFQQEGDEPFRDIYPSHALYFHAKLGEQVDDAVDYFRNRAEEVEVEEQGTAAAETYIDLLDRLGRYHEAALATVKLIPPGVYPQGLAPTLIEICQKSGDFEPLIEGCKERDDLLGFAAGLIQAKIKQ